MPFELVLDGLLRSAAVFSTLLVLMTAIGPRLSLGRPQLQRLGYGIALGLFSAASMLWPISRESGVLLDVRVVPVVLAAPFYGLEAGAVTLAIAVFTRVVLGGAAMPAGVAVLILAFFGSAALAVLRGWRLRGEGEVRTAMPFPILLLIAAVATASMAIPMMARLVDLSATSPAFASASEALVLVIPVLTLVAGLLLRSDERRRELDRGFKEKSERLAAVMTDLPGVVFRRVWGEDRLPRFQLVAGRVREVIGIEAEDLMRDSNALIGRILPEDAPRVRATIEQAVSGDGLFEAEFRIFHGDGSVRWLHGKSQLLDEPDNGGVGHGLLMDITRIKNAEDVAAKAKERADFLAKHDALTGLTDRFALIHRAMQELQVSSDGVGMIYLDLIGSKGINERFGYAVGDRRVVEAARRLAPLLPEGFIARVGGDVFGLLVVDGRSEQAVAALAERAIALLAEPLDLDGAVIPLGARCGYAVVDGEETTAVSLLRSAEIALEAARERNEARPLRHSAAIEIERAERRASGEALAGAVESGAITLVWQPIVDAAGRVAGHEALARWIRPGRGAVPPDVFVAEAERIGLWQALDRFIMKAACRMAAQRESLGWISVNVSSNWVHEGDLVAVVREALAVSGLRPDRLWLEFTERTVMDRLDRARQLISDLRALGVEAAIDDFGAVYSSLSYLHRLPVRKIKLDRSFITDIETNRRARLIVGAVLALCRQLEISVVAEGVETEEQRLFLKAHGCGFMQGYLIGRPAAA